MAERNPFEEITPGTPIKEFPGYYNQDIGALVNKINELEDAIAEKDSQISKLRNDFVAASNKLRAEYTSILDPDKVPEDNGTYVLRATRTSNGIKYTWVQI